MGRKKGSIPWNKGIKYTSKMKENLDLSGLSIGRQKGIKKPGLSINNPMFKKENIEKVQNNPNVKDHQFKKGHVPWSKGKTGIHFSPDTEFKEGITTGPNHPSWKGGLTPKNLRIRGSKKFIDWRNNVFKRDNYTCQLCKKRGGIIHANHIKKFSDYPKLRFEIHNGITLCKECHHLVTWKEEEWEEILIFLLKQKNKL